jgi:hypothetical protein
MSRLDTPYYSKIYLVVRDRLLGVRIPAGIKNVFLLQKRPDTLWCPGSLLFKGFQSSFSWIRQTQRTAGHPCLSSDKVGMSGNANLLPSMLLEHGDEQIYFYLWFK